MITEMLLEVSKRLPFALQLLDQLRDQLRSHFVLVLDLVVEVEKQNEEELVFTSATRTSEREDFHHHSWFLVAPSHQGLSVTALFCVYKLTRCFDSQ